MQTHHCNSKADKKIKKVVFGLLVISAGAILLGFNLGYLHDSWRPVVFSWQMLLIAIGLINIFGKDSWLTGFLLVTVGSFFLLPEIYEFNFNFTALLWPLLLIVAGLLILFKFGRKNWFHHGSIISKVESGVLEEVNIFGGSKQIITSEDFKGGKMVNIFGGAEIDLTKTKMQSNVCELEMVCIFGGVSLIIPPDWNVKMNIASVMGGFADKRYSHNITNADKTLIIKGVAILGGGEIKNI